MLIGSSLHMIRFDYVSRWILLVVDIDLPVCTGRPIPVTSERSNQTERILRNIIYRLIAPDRAGNDAGAGRRVCCHAVVPAADAARRLCRCRPRQIATLVPIIEKIITFVPFFQHYIGLFYGE